MVLSKTFSSREAEISPFSSGSGDVYQLTTHAVTVIVRAIYLEEQSAPAADHYVWAYYVRIENGNTTPVQLRARSWNIVDTNGIVQDIYGNGIVGELPILKPKDVFEYTSGTSLSTPSGLMSGIYHMVDARGKNFDVAIPPFSLDSPYQQVVLN